MLAKLADGIVDPYASDSRMRPALSCAFSTANQRTVQAEDNRAIDHSWTPGPAFASWEEFLLKLTPVHSPSEFPTLWNFPGHRALSAGGDWAGEGEEGVSYHINPQ